MYKQTSINACSNNDFRTFIGDPIPFDSTLTPEELSDKVLYMTDFVLNAWLSKINCCIGLKDARKAGLPHQLTCCKP